MSVSIGDARKELKALASQMRALMVLDDELVKIGGLDQMIAERETRLRDLDKQIMSSSSSYGELEDKIDALRQEMEEEKKRHQVLLGEAGREAESIKAKARDEVNYLIKDAHTKAERIVSDAEGNRRNIEAKVAELKNTAKAIQQEIKQAEERRSEIDKEIARIKNLVMEN